MLSARHPARAKINWVFGAAVLFSAASVIGCSSDRVVQPDSYGDVTAIEGDFPTRLGKPVPIEFDTYENSRQVVHPSAVSFPSAWNGRRFWLALTPYPNSDTRVENPSLFSSESGDDWTVPSGVTNPVAKTSRGYLSDPDLTYDPATNELRLYYREVVESRRGHKRPRHQADIVYLTRSNDGTRWSAPAAIVSDIGRFVVSPAVARGPAGDWQMWAVDAGRSGCNARETRILLRRSSDGISWTVPTTISFFQPGFTPWHLDVQFVPQLNAYWALVAAYPRGSACTASSLFLATSVDGVNWTTYASPVLARGALPQFSANVYRSTFAFEPDGRALTLWLTGATTVKRTDQRNAPVLRWSAAVWHTQAPALLEYVRTERHTLVVPDSEPSFLRRLAVENALP
jgi:hypothetical protein